MSFIDEVRNAQQSHFVEKADMDVAIDDAYQRLIKESVEDIKKKIIGMAKNDAQNGVKNSCITGTIGLSVNGRTLPMGQGCTCGKYKYCTVYKEYEGTGLYVKFDDVDVFHKHYNIFDTCIGWVSITEFGKRYFEDFRKACSKENIILEAPRAHLNIRKHTNYILENKPFPVEGIAIDEKYKSREIIDGGYLFVNFSFKIEYGENKH